MNELAEQCVTRKFYVDHASEDFDYKKFAELIVNECAEVAGCNVHVSGFALGDLIKQHFGVEE